MRPVSKRVCEQVITSKIYTMEFERGFTVLKDACKGAPPTLGDLLEGPGKISLLGWAYLRTLAALVLQRFYAGSVDATELHSEAVIDAAQFLANLSEPPRSLQNVLFTRIRNTISNTLYHRMRFAMCEQLEDLPDEKAPSVLDRLEMLETLAGKYCTKKQRERLNEYLPELQNKIY